MKQNKLPLILLTIITIFLFQNSVLIQETILKSCHLFITKLFPSLFPMMILSELFLYFGLPEYLCHLFGKAFSKIFHTTPYGAFAFFIACFSGSPTNAYVIQNLVSKQYLTAEEASHILSFSFFNNPLFIYTMLSLIFPNDLKTVLIILILPYLVNCLIGIITRPSKRNVSSTISPNTSEKFGIFFTQSIRNSMNTLLFILGTITIFFILNAFINPQNIPFISGLLEISQGLNSLINFNSNLFIKKILATMMISFGGLSIHLQIKGIISKNNISYSKFLKMRILQTMISIFLIALIG